MQKPQPKSDLASNILGSTNMKRLLGVFLLFACNLKSDPSTAIAANSTMENYYNNFDEANHLIPEFDKLKFDTLNS
jgi:hypothetical protein